MQGLISLGEDQVDIIFGKLGTHSKCAGTTLWLRDAFLTDFRGRKVTISAPSRRIAATACRSLLYTLSPSQGSDTSIINTSTWSYIDTKGEKYGPYPFSKMLHWSQNSAFSNDALPVQHSTLKCWLPLWFLQEIYELNALGQDSLHSSEEAEMIDWEATVQEVNEQRQHNGILNTTAIHALDTAPDINTNTQDITDSAVAMEYEFYILPENISINGSVYAWQSLRLFVIVDTNIFLSHGSFLDRVFTELIPYRPDVEVQLVVPWIVLNELDCLKDCGRKAQADAARLALQRIRSVRASMRDGYMHVQTAVEHTHAIEAIPLPDLSSRELRNDDFILQTCLYYETHLAHALHEMGHGAVVFLLSNDKGLCTRAEVNGVSCFTANEFPRTAKEIINEASIASTKKADKTPPLNHQSYTSLPHASLPHASLPHASLPHASLPLHPQEQNTSLHPHQDQDQINHPMTNTMTNTRHRNNKDTSPTRSIYEILDAQSLAPVLSPQPELPKESPLVTTTNTTTAPPLHNNNTAPPIPTPAIKNECGPFFLEDMEYVLEHCLSPAVAYVRQHDLGDLWLEMLEDDLQPPWSASAVLKVITRHSTSFWNILKHPSDMQNIHKIIRYITSRGKNNSGMGLIEMFAFLIALLKSFIETLPDEQTLDPGNMDPTIQESIQRDEVIERLGEGISMLQLQQSHMSPTL